MIRTKLSSILGSASSALRSTAGLATSHAALHYEAGTNKQKRKCNMVGHHWVASAVKNNWKNTGAKNDIITLILLTGCPVLSQGECLQGKRQHGSNASEHASQLHPSMRKHAFRKTYGFLNQLSRGFGALATSKNINTTETSRDHVI